MKIQKLRDDRGETLLEILVALSIMGIAVAVIIGGIAASIRFTDIHRKQAAAGAYVRDFAENVEKSVARIPGGYVVCNEAAAVSAYRGSFTLSDPKYQAAVTNVEYWDGSGWAN